jgi:hypothetical protein
MYAGEAHSKFGAKSVIVVNNASYSSTGTQVAMPEKVKCCSGWISMVIGTAPTRQKQSCMIS